MATYVLVHGGWHGSWCWKRVRALLQSAGHQVFTPTLSGLGERTHLLSPAIGLQTHIDDVANLLRWEQLDDVILCGHSYAGLVITGVTEAMPERIISLIYLDAFLPNSGQSLHDMLPPPVAASQRALAGSHGEGWRVPPTSAAFFAVNSADQDWVDRQCTPQSLATFEEKIRFTERAAIPDTRFILANGWSNSPFPFFANVARERGWSVQEIATGHDVMLDDPAGLVELLR